MPFILQYLLHLAEHPEVSRRHSESKAAAEKEMKSFPLTDEQCSIILSGDMDKIANAVQAELPKATALATPLSVRVEVIMPPIN
jgi:hypothetical protein